jgi:hypothetical protein
MWALTNQTRFKAERTFARDQEGAEIWIIAVRGTFAISEAGSVALAEDQQDVCRVPKYFGEPGKTSLRYDMDLVRTKRGTDVILHAHAYAPGGRAASSVDVSWSVGPLSKRLRIFGDRVWRKDWSTLEPDEPQPFTSIPIRYERAWGGPVRNREAFDPFNPVGVGTDASLDAPVPNVESPDNPIRSSLHPGPPAGFGPIPFGWQPRVKLAGTYDEAWRNERRPLVPNDFEDGYFRCAPADQQVNGFLQGGEEVTLRNLTPDGLLRFELPRVSFGFRTRIAGGLTQHRGSLHTVIIEPQERRLIMVWQTALPCHHTLYTLKETVVFEKERKQLGLSVKPGAELVV